MLDSESGALEAGSAAPRLCNLEQGAAPLSASAIFLRAGDTAATARAKAWVSPTSSIAPSPFPPSFTCSVPIVGTQALSSPKSGGGVGMTRRQIILTTGSGHRQGFGKVAQFLY